MVAIVGGGIAGLAAAYFLRAEPVQVIVLEGAARLGGKLSLAEIAGVRVDVGAEALLARRPEGLELIRGAGLDDQRVDPGSTAAWVWSRGEMHPLRPAVHGRARRPGRAGPQRGAVRGRAGPGQPRAGAAAIARDGDVPVASYVSARFGQEVVDRLVNPLLGGVYAGRSEELSFEATLPALAVAARGQASLAAAAASLLPPPPPAARQPRPRRHRSSPRWRAASARCPPRSPRRPARRSAPARWSASWFRRQAAGG